MIMSFGPGNAFLGWVPKTTVHVVAEDRQQAVDAQNVQKNVHDEAAGDAAVEVWQKAAESVERGYPDLSRVEAVEAVEAAEEAAKKTTEDNQRSSPAAAASSSS